MTKFKFKVTVHYSLWAKCTRLRPLKPKIDLWHIIDLMYIKNQKEQKKLIEQLKKCEINTANT